MSTDEFVFVYACVTQTLEKEKSSVHSGQRLSGSDQQKREEVVDDDDDDVVKGEEERGTYLFYTGVVTRRTLKTIECAD
jgi:hypothetical protein